MLKRGRIAPRQSQGHIRSVIAWVFCNDYIHIVAVSESIHTHSNLAEELAMAAAGLRRGQITSARHGQAKSVRGCNRRDQKYR